MNILLFASALLFSAGLYKIFAYILKIPEYYRIKAVINIKNLRKKMITDHDAFINNIASKVSKYVYIDSYKKTRLTALLKSAEMTVTAEMFTALAYVKAGIIFILIFPCLIIAPVIAPIFIILSIGLYFKEINSAENIVKKRREQIENELSRFVDTLVQEFKSSRDVLSILEHYQKNAGNTMKNELAITTADMRTGNYEAALTRFEGRITSAMLSDIVRGLISVLRGDDGVTYFRMLSHDLKQIELQRLKRLALERPPKIRKYSFLLLACMLMIYMGVMGYQIVLTMGGMF